MKTLIFLLFLCSLYIIQSEDICSQRDDCLVAYKIKMWVPRRYKSGVAYPLELIQFEWATMIVYADRMVVAEAQQMEQFNRNTPMGKLQRTFSFDQFQTECGLNGNIICTLKEIKNMHPQLRYKEAIALEPDFETKCLGIPIIDGSVGLLQDNILYFCPGGSYTNVKNMQYILSKIINRYQLEAVRVKGLHMNGMVRKMNDFHVTDTNNAMNPAALYLFNHVLRAYKDPKNMSSESFKLSVKQIDARQGVRTVSKAIVAKVISIEDFNTFKSQKQAPDNGNMRDCCIHIPLKSPLLPRGDSSKYTFICVYLTKEKKDDSIKCEPIADNWAQQINAVAQRQLLIDDLDYLTMKVKTVSCEKGEKFTLQFQSIIKYMKNVFDEQQQNCELLQLLENQSAQDCAKLKEDSVLSALTNIYGNQMTLITMVQNCMLNKNIDLDMMSRIE